MDFQKPLNIKFNENPTNGRCVVTCGHIDERMDGQTDIMRLLVVFHNFVLKMHANKMFIQRVYRISPLSGVGMKDRLSVSP